MRRIGLCITHLQVSAGVRISELFVLLSIRSSCSSIRWFANERLELEAKATLVMIAIKGLIIP